MTPITLATLCSGVEAVSLAFEDLPIEPVFFADNAAFPTSFLAQRHPETPNLGNILTIDGEAYRGQVDWLWASFPCQDFSAAGKGKGVDGVRGFLTLAGIKLVDEIDPKVFLFENVPGLLNDQYNAFGQFLGALAGEYGPLEPPGAGWADAGYVLGPRRSIAWRVLDAQHFGLPQQRRRVYLVACPRGGADPRDVLFERREEGDAAGERAERGPDAVAGTAGSPVAPAYRIAIRGRILNGVKGQQIEQGDEVSNCLRTAGGGGSVAQVLCQHEGRWTVRALTPVEYERLQGMPDDYTLVNGATTTARRSAVGNSLAVPVVKWLGERVVAALAA